MVSYDALYKLVLCGAGQCGKSSLLIRFADDTFDPSYTATIGVDFKIRTVDVDGKAVKLQMWDTGGGARFRTLTYAYYRGASGVLLCFDASKADGFEDMQTRYPEVKGHAGDDTVFIVVGCRADEANADCVAQATRWAESNGLRFELTSAKTGSNVADTFLGLAEDIMFRAGAKPRPPRPAAGSRKHPLFPVSKTRGFFGITRRS